MHLVSRHRQFALVLCFFASSSFIATSCKAKKKRSAEQQAPVGKTESIAQSRMTISVVGTNDVHGHMARLPIFGGYLANLRAAREDGGVLLVDGGDMFQGTLESNQSEGAAVVAAYAALGYDAVTIGNHEFDFGPVGPKAVPEQPTDDPQGALRARAAEAPFPFLAANIVNNQGSAPDWKNVFPSKVVKISGVQVGLIGVTTIDTPKTTIASNFVGLNMVAPAEAIAREATRMRAEGIAVIVVAAHAGASCREFHDPHSISSCKPGEIFEVAESLPTGLVDVIVAGHTHSGVAHRVNGIAIIESYAKGRAFGRVDLMLRDGVLKESVIFPPRDLCSGGRALGAQPCNPGSYEGRPVLADQAVEKIAEVAAGKAQQVRDQLLGVEVASRIERSYASESALGNLFVDLMLEARPEATVAITNGGGLRADLPTGPLRYGSLFEAMPFDNQFAFVSLNASQFAQVLAVNLAGKSGILSIAGLTAKARCVGAKVSVSLLDETGKPLPAKTELRVVASDFLAAGGDGAFSKLGLQPSAFRYEQGETIRDAMADVLRKRKTPLRREDLIDENTPRITLPKARPLSCP